MHRSSAAEERALAEKAERERHHAKLLAAQQRVLDTKVRVVCRRHAFQRVPCAVLCILFSLLQRQGEEDEARAKRHVEQKILDDRREAARREADRQRRLDDVKAALEAQQVRAVWASGN